MPESTSTGFDPILYQKLGEVAVSWSGFEAHIAEFLTYLLGAHRAPMYVLNQTTSVELQMKWIRALCDIRFAAHPEMLGSLNDLFERIDVARADRNAWIHGLWTGPEPGAVLIQTIRLNRSEWIRSEFVTVADFDDLIDRIGEIVAELISLGRALGFLPD